MATKIEWTEETWNPITGCSPISSGCDHCYAMRMARRLAGRAGYPKIHPFRPGTYHEDKIKAPFHWRKPRMVFVGSMGDMFHPAVAFEHILEVWTTMTRLIIPGPDVPPERRNDYNHTYQILTKRPREILNFIEWNRDRYERGSEDCIIPSKLFPPWIWIGVTAEHQGTAEDRIPVLLEIPAALRFVSVEPMIGPIDLEHVYLSPGFLVDVLRGGNWGSYYPGKFTNHSDMTTIDWVICGGETGPGARWINPHWVHQLARQCREAGKPFFFKKWGDWMKRNGKIVPDQMPREYPRRENQ